MYEKPIYRLFVLLKRPVCEHRPTVCWMVGVDQKTMELDLQSAPKKQKQKKLEKQTRPWWCHCSFRLFLVSRNWSVDGGYGSDVQPRRHGPADGSSYVFFFIWAWVFVGVGCCRGRGGCLALAHRHEPTQCQEETQAVNFTSRGTPPGLAGKVPR